LGLVRFDIHRLHLGRVHNRADNAQRKFNMTSQRKYLALTAQIEATYGFGFTDMCVDAENCGIKDDNSEEFWGRMLSALHDSAGMRLGEAGFDATAVGISF